MGIHFHNAKVHVLLHSFVLLPDLPALYTYTSRCTCPTYKLWHVEYNHAFGALTCKLGHIAHDRAPLAWKDT